MQQGLFEEKVALITGCRQILWKLVAFG